MKRRIKDALKRLLFRFYKLGSRFGVHILIPGTKLLERRLQAVPIDVCRKLNSGDFLFIDSSHTFKPGSDVNDLYLTHNDRMAILFCLSHLHHDRQEQLKEIFPEYDPAPDIDGLNPESVRPFEQPRRHFPASIYLETR